MGGRVRAAGRLAAMMRSNELDLERMSAFRYGGEVSSGGRVLS